MSRKGYIFNKKIACATCAGGRMARSEPLYRAAIWLMAIAAPLSIPVLIQDNLPLWATGGLEIIFMIAIAVFLSHSSFSFFTILCCRKKDTSVNHAYMRKQLWKISRFGNAAIVHFFFWSHSSFLSWSLGSFWRCDVKKNSRLGWEFLFNEGHIDKKPPIQ